MDEAPSRPPVATHWPGDFPSALDRGRFGRPAHAVLLGGLVLVAMLGAATLGLNARQRTEVEQRDRHRLEQLAGVMECHVTQVFESSNLVLDNLAESLLQNPQALASCLHSRGTTCKSCCFAPAWHWWMPRGGRRCPPPCKTRPAQVQVQRRLTAPSAAGHSMVIGPVDARGTPWSHRQAHRQQRVALIPLPPRVALGAGREVRLHCRANPRCWQRFSMICLHGSHRHAGAVGA